MSRRVIVLAAAMLLSACKTCPDPVEVQVPVEVPGPVTYVPLPADSLAECGAAPELRDHMAGGDLLEAARAWRARARCISAQLEGIRTLQPVSQIRP